MMSARWNPWKITAIGLGLAMTTALIIGVGAANWSRRDEAQKPTNARLAPVTPTAAVATPQALPSQAVIDTCNQQAAREAPQNKSTELVINENRKSDERYRAAYGSCMQSRGHTS
jgi:hypothetical protein